jgi:hypothetical protein
MGALRTLYEAPCRFYVGDDRPLKIRWFWAQDGAQVGPHPTRFWEGLRYEQTSPRPPGGTGESSGPDRHFGEWATPPWMTGVEPSEGTEADFRGLSPLPSGPIAPAECSAAHHPWLESVERLTLSPARPARQQQRESVRVRAVELRRAVRLRQVESVIVRAAPAVPAALAQVERLTLAPTVGATVRQGESVPVRAVELARSISLDQMEAVEVDAVEVGRGISLDQVESFGIIPERREGGEG